MVRNYIKIALRNIWKNRIYSAINITGLSCAIAICLLIFLFAKDELTYDRFHSKIDRIYRLNGRLLNPSNNSWQEFGSSSPAIMSAVQDQVVLENSVRIYSSSAFLNINNEPERSEFLFADPAIFEVFDLPFISGSASGLEDNVNSIVLDQDQAKLLFGEDDPLDKTVTLSFSDETIDFIVAGIIKNIPDNSSLSFNMLIPFEKYRDLAPERRFKNLLDLHMTNIVLLGEGVKAENAETALNSTLKSSLSEENFSVSLQPFKNIHFEQVGRSSGIASPGNSSISFILISIAAFLLMIACINFTNLSIGMALPRMREIGLRKVVGANRKQVFIQFLGEAFILSVLSFTLALLLADLSLTTFEEITNTRISILGSMDAYLIFGSIALMLMTTVLSGGYPAMVASGFSPSKSLKGTQKVGQGSTFTKGLVVFQFMLGALFLIGTLTVEKQMSFIRNFDLGYDDEGLVSVRMPVRDREKVYDQFKQRLSKFSFVQTVTGNTGSGWGTNLIHNDQDYSVNHDRVDYDYFKSLDIDIVQGRNFDVNRPSDERDAIIVNKAFVEELGLENPIGERVAFDYYDDMSSPQIIGVTEDFNYNSLHRDIAPMIFYVHPAHTMGNLLVRIDESQSNKAISEIEAIWKEMVEGRPFVYSFVEDDNQQAYNRELSEQRVFNYASGLAIIISCLGLFGLANLHIQQRYMEIGVRKVFGASTFRLLGILSKTFVRLSLIAFVLASPLAWWSMERWLNDFAYRTDISPSIFLLAGSSIVVLSLISIAYQAITAALTNPIRTLRNE